MNIVFSKPALPAFHPGEKRTRTGGEYQEFLSGMHFLLGEKWGEKNPLAGELANFAPAPDSPDRKPAKQLQSIAILNRERVQSAIHQKEMTKWQTHP